MSIQPVRRRHDGGEDYHPDEDADDAGEGVLRPQDEGVIGGFETFVGRLIIPSAAIDLPAYPVILIRYMMTT